MTTAPEDIPTELWQLSAGQVATGIAERRFSAREAVAACLARIDRVNPQLNAIVELDAADALAAADVADARVAAGETLGPLHGVPVATKINTDQAGRATTDGVVAFKDHIATEDSPQLAALRAAGAIFVGRTNVPAFSLRWFSENDLHGRTLNPWSPRHTPGGSSGGAGSAVAAGMVPLAQGNDVGGSIRYPAYVNGICGIRCTPGRVTKSFRTSGLDLPLSEQLFTVDGPLARRVADLRLALSVSTVHDPRDGQHVPASAVPPPASEPRRVALVRNPGVVDPDAAVNGALDAAAAALGDAGYRVEEVELPLLGEAFRLWWALALTELRGLAPLIEEVGDEAAKASMRFNFEVAAEMHGEPTLESYIAGFARRGTLIDELSIFMDRHAIVLLPVSAEPPFRHGEDAEDLGAARRLIEAQWPMMSIATLGVPGAAVPTGMVAGLPTGVQLLGRRYAEDDVLTAAEAIEARLGSIAPIDPRGSAG